MLKAFLKKNWFGILGILIGTGLSFYFYRASNSPPELVLLVDPVRTPIIDSSRFPTTSLRVLHTNGTEINNDVTAIKFYLWNNGRGSIKSSDILEPLLISIKDHNSIILDYKILKGSRTVVKPVMEKNPEDPNRSLMLSFSILESGDGFAGQIIYEGRPDIEFSVSGTIEKIRHITTNSELIKVSFLSELVLMPLSIFSTLIILTLTVFLIEKVRTKSKIWGRIFISIVSILIIAVMVFGVREFISEAKKTASTSIIQKIPNSLLP